MGHMSLQMINVETFVVYVATTNAYIAATFVFHHMWHMLLQMIRLSQYVAYVAIYDYM